MANNEKGDLSETSINDISQESIGLHPGDLNRLITVETHDWSILPKVLSSITLNEWRTAQIGKISFKKSAIDVTLTLESTMLDVLNKMSD